jgi:hypothetical protein
MPETLKQESVYTKFLVVGKLKEVIMLFFFFKGSFSVIVQNEHHAFIYTENFSVLSRGGDYAKFWH